MPALAEVGRQALHTARLAPAIEATCLAALTRPGRLFSATPVWARLFLAWSDALGVPERDVLLPAAVACEYLATGFDLIDDVYDQAHSSLADQGLIEVLPAGVALLQLAQETLARLALPSERSALTEQALARASRRVFAAQAHDYALRSQPLATKGEVLGVLRRRSGTLGALPCQCATLLAGASPRLVALAGRFGRDLGCAAQLEDDLADRAVDAQGGRATLPTLLARRFPDDPELAEATAWVLMQQCLQGALHVIQRLPGAIDTEPLWTLLPSGVRAA